MSEIKVGRPKGSIIPAATLNDSSSLMCGYGCNQNAQFLVGKNQTPCCSNNPRSCPAIHQKIGYTLAKTLAVTHPVGDTKKCTLCKKVLPATSDYFYSRTEGTKRIMPHCIKCHNKKGSEWRKANREKTNAAQRRRWITKKYGMPKEDWEAALPKGCALCGEPFKLETRGNDKHTIGGLNPVVDHDHKTGQVRAVLHAKCNSAIGLLDEIPEKARLAYEYLLKYKG
jgi:hypothetical protein